MNLQLLLACSTFSNKERKIVALGIINIVMFNTVISMRPSFDIPAHHQIFPVALGSDCGSVTVCAYACCQACHTSMGQHRYIGKPLAGYYPNCVQGLSLVSRSNVSRSTTIAVPTWRILNKKLFKDSMQQAKPSYVLAQYCNQFFSL